MEHSGGEESQLSRDKGCNWPIDDRAGEPRDCTAGLHPYLEKTLHIAMLAVLPEYRHHGIARGLIQGAIDRSRHAGVTAVSLLSFEQDERLVRSYESLGFQIVGRSPMIPHPLFQCDGNLVAMVMPIALSKR